MAIVCKSNEYVHLSTTVRKHITGENISNIEWFEVRTTKYGIKNYHDVINLDLVVLRYILLLRN